MNTFYRKTFLSMVSLLLLVVLSACSGGEAEENGQGSILVNININGTYADSGQDGETTRRTEASQADCQALGIDTILIEVYDADGTLLATGGPFSCTAQKGTVSEIPAGLNRNIVVLCFDADNNVVFRGNSTGITVIAGRTAYVEDVIVNSFVPQIDLANQSFRLNQQPNVTWAAVNNATGYRVTISTNSDLGDPLFDDIITDPNVSLPVAETPTTYYLQISAIDDRDNQSRPIVYTIAITEEEACEVSVPALSSCSELSPELTDRLACSETYEPNAVIPVDSFVRQTPAPNSLVPCGSTINIVLSSGPETDPCNDTDMDGICADSDNCPTVSNNDQADLDQNGIGDACDDDIDGDGIPNDQDNCPAVSNSDQTDLDHDGIGQACDTNIDNDGDGLVNSQDNCPDIPNSDQIDTDSDGRGDVCDDDLDGDGIINTQDNCVALANQSQVNTDNDEYGDMCDDDDDNDGIADTIDNCPVNANRAQRDADNDGIGNECDFDIDGDGQPNVTDNCAFTANADQADNDHDGKGDVCDSCPNDPADDSDGDGVCGNVDNCPTISNPDQANHDSDTLGDACDDDDDNDGYLDTVDNCPLIDNPEQVDSDEDGLGDACDACTDSDGDGVGDTEGDSNCPLPGIDNCPGTANPDQADLDNDGFGDVCDACTDSDGDGVGDPGFDNSNCSIYWVEDNCPDIANPDQADYDEDGQGDACDECNDLDGDGFGNPQYNNTCQNDCNDEAADINPDALEICGNRIDDNCNNQTDEGCLDIGVVYVDPTVANSNLDGRSWVNAVPTINDAVEIAERGDEIWVRAGTYQLTETIRIFESVAIYGGFDGNELERSARNSDPQRTIIDGQIATRCVEFLDLSSLIDGFSFRNASERAIYCYTYNAPISIINCIFENNSTQADGGAIFLDAMTPFTIDQCIFTNNSAGGSGGAVRAFSFEMEITNCQFVGNSSASGANRNGGAVCITGASDATVNITDCNFSQNSASRAGAVYSSSVTLTIDRCSFNGNNATQDMPAGALFISNSMQAIVRNSTFSTNSASWGGACGNYDSNVIIDNCMFEDNFTVQNPDFQDNSQYGGAVYNNNDIERTRSITISSSIFRNNTGTFGGGVSSYQTPVIVTNCLFWNNSARETNGGGICTNHGSAMVTNTTFYGNSAGSGGGAISHLIDEDALFSAVYTNCIIWNGEFSIHNRNPNPDGTVVFSHCDIQYGYSDFGTLTANISLDPLFAGAQDGNFQLQSASPCIDSGDRYAQEMLPVDLAGNPRPTDGNHDGETLPDMGAYEYNSPLRNYMFTNATGIYYIVPVDITWSGDAWYYIDGSIQMPTGNLRFDRVYVGPNPDYVHYYDGQEMLLDVGNNAFETLPDWTVGDLFNMTGDPTFVLTNIY